MISVEKIKNKILEDANSKALAIEEQAKREAKDILADAAKTAESKSAQILKSAENESAEVYRRLISIGGLEGRKEILRAKQEVVDNAFKVAMNKVVNLPDAQYQELLEAMIVDAASDSNGEILISKKDAGRIDSRFTDNVNKRLRSVGKTGALTVSKDKINTVGGFVLRYGEMEINSTLEILFGTLRPQLEGDVVKTLFNA